MLNSKTNKQLSRSEMKSISGGNAIAGPCPTICSYVLNGQTRRGCPAAEECVTITCTNPTRIGRVCQPL